MIQILPKTHLFLLQNILIVIQALTNSEKTLFKPFSIARAISPSIFPLMNLSHWKYGTKLFEAIILLTDKLVTDSVKQNIINSYAKFNQNAEVSNTADEINVDTISEKSSSKSMSSIEETDHKHFLLHSEEPAYESESELDSSDVQHSDYMSSSDENFSSSDNENPISSNSEVVIISEDELLKQSSSSKNSSLLKGEIVIYDQDISNEDISNADNMKSCKNICMGVKMKEIYHSCGKSMELDLSMDTDNSKENNPCLLNNERVTVGLRHRSLLKAENLSIRELNRSSSAIVTSPRIPRLRNRDYCDLKSPGSQVIRKNSRKALSAVVEMNNSSDVNHRSRSPNVKSLIRMYEEKNKLITPDDLMESDQRNSRLKSDFEDSNSK